MYLLNYSHKINNIPLNFSQNMIYFDIETTGLSKRNALVYLIGCTWYESDGNWHFHQWFAENPEEELDILKAFSLFLKDYPTVAHYNGTTFDLPFLAYRCEVHGLPNPFEDKNSRDLYQEFRPLKELLSLPGRKQRDLEIFLSCKREDPYTGKDCIKLYRNLIKYRDTSYAQPLLLHNKEDLLGLIQIQSLYVYFSLFQGDFTLISLLKSEESFTAYMKPVQPLPKAFVYEYEFFSLSGNGNSLQADFHYLGGYLRNYFSDYKNYYYLPAEDTAIHKSVGAYLDRSHRQNAKKDTCYTRFLPTPEFFQDMDKVEGYLQTNIPILLSL